jgi:hypothetical protein
VLRITTCKEAIVYESSYAALTLLHKLSFGITVTETVLSKTQRSPRRRVPRTNLVRSDPSCRLGARIYPSLLFRVSGDQHRHRGEL